MSLRSKTQKAKKFGTPSAPSPTAQKSSPTSPRATGGTPSAPSPSAQPRTSRAKKFGTPSAPSPTAQKSSPTSPRATGGTPSAPSSAAQKTSSPKTYGITQTQAVQEQFKTRLQALTAPIRNTIRTLTTRVEALDKEGGGRSPDLGARDSAKIVREQIANEQKKIQQIEQEQHDIELQSNVNQIIQSLEGGNVLAPDYFQNNIAWVKTGAITQQAFLDSYYYLSNQGIIHSAPTEPIIEEPIIEEPIIELPELLPEAEAQIEPIPIITPAIDDSINTNMVTQQVINFNIINGRAVGSIKFVATNNFNPYYYNKEIVNLVQFKTPNGVTLLVKENRLRFTETERDEVISYDENIQENTRITVESFVWEWMDKPAGAFSNMFSIYLKEGDPPKPVMTGFMGAGVAGAIAGLVLLGFIVDSKVGK